MPRQSVTLTEPNDSWLKHQVESQEYTSKSEALNDLIRQARQKEEELQWLRQKLETAEKSGVSSASKEQIKDAARKFPDA